MEKRDAEKAIIPLFDFTLYDDKKYGDVLTFFNREAESKKLIKNFMKFFLYGNDSLWDMCNLHWFYNLNFVLPLTVRLFNFHLKMHQRNLEAEYDFVFKKMLTQLSSLSAKDQQTFALQLNLLINNLLSLRIFTEPQDGHQAVLPVFNKHLGLWEPKLCLFQRKLITNHEQLQPLLKPEDHVYCYIIDPQDEKNPEHYPVIVAFMGTTFPAGQGIGMQNITNAMPDYEIGQYLIEADIFGHDEIYQSLNRPEFQHREKVFTGASLGGMLAQMYGLNLAPRLQSKISVYPINPATFFELPTEAHPYFGAFFRMDPAQRGEWLGLSQQGDPVSGVGKFLEFLTVIRTKFPLPQDRAKHPEYEMKHPSIEKLMDIAGSFSWWSLFTPGSGKRFILHGYISHLVVHLTHPGVQLEIVDPKVINRDPARIRATEIAKTKIRSFLYEQAKKDTPHLSNLPKLDPLGLKESPESYSSARLRASGVLF